MIYLLASVGCGVIISAVFKVTGNKNMDKLTVTMFNYMTVVAVSLTAAIKNGSLKLLQGANISHLIKEAGEVILSGGMLSSGSSALWALAIGVLFGPLYCLMFVQNQKSVQLNGMGLSNIYSRLGVIVPIVISILCWREYPTQAQAAGTILCIAVILLSGTGGKTKSKLNTSLILLFLYSGSVQLSKKIYQRYGQIECTDLLMLFIFASALTVSAVLKRRSKSATKKEEILTGLLLGVPNLLTTYFMVRALSCLNTSVAYMLSGTLSIIAVSLLGIAVFKEKPEKKELISYALTAGALVLMNL